jgi:hypothetical protein
MTPGEIIHYVVSALVVLVTLIARNEIQKVQIENAQRETKLREWVRRNYVAKRPHGHDDEDEE